MSVILTLQNASKTRTIPSKKLFKAWINKTIPPGKKKYEIVIRIVGIKEITRLNRQYRKKNQPTNILSFNFYPPKGIKTKLLGDLIICAPILKREAKLQHKTLKAHWAHLTVHGTLHLLGYDHKKLKEAKSMTRLEGKILKQFGFVDQPL